MKELKLQTSGKPLDRDYFKYKDNPRKRKTRLTDCCGKDEDKKEETRRTENRGGTTKKGDVRKTARRAYEPSANATGRRNK